MAVGEPKQPAKNWGVIKQVSWTDWTTQDVYYWMDHSFQYSANINTDDELHGIKLANRANFTPNYGKCQLISLGEHWVMALPIWQDLQEFTAKRMQYNGFYDEDGDTWPDWPSPLNSDGEPVSKRTELDSSAGSALSSAYQTVPGVVFQDRFWFWANRTNSQTNKGYLMNVPIDAWNWHWIDSQNIFLPYDHPDYTDESIEDASNITEAMQWAITAILNYNNTRLVVACGTDIWVYYPELDHQSQLDWRYWVQGWKKTLHFEAGTTIVALTCTFEYLKVRAVDEGWNTKVYYYQGNNNLRSTFVYNEIDLTGVRVLHVYSINGTDYYVSSITNMATDALVDFNKMVGNTPVPLFHQRAWLTMYDTNFKAPYFVGPIGIDAPYNAGSFYIADAYGVFKFKYNPQGFDKGYMKWHLNDNKQVYGVCENKGFLYVSDEDGCRAMRLYDTWVDGYQSSWVLISREYEGREWGTYTKMLDEVRMNFELNPNIKESDYSSNDEPYWIIDVYVSPNNLWKNTHTFTEANGWYHAMHITRDSKGTRTEKSNLFNDLWWTTSNKKSSFKFDWQTITYAIVITRGDEVLVTPIVRQIDLRYHSKDKINNVYDIN